MKYGLEAFSDFSLNPQPSVSAAKEQVFGCLKPFDDDVFSPLQAVGFDEHEKSLFDLVCSQSVRADSSDDSSSTTDIWRPSSPFGSCTVDDFLNEGDLIAFLRDSYKLLRDPQDDPFFLSNCANMGDPWFLSNCANMDDVCSLGRSSTNPVSGNQTISTGNVPSATITSSATAFPTFPFTEVAARPPESHVLQASSLLQTSLAKTEKLSCSQTALPVFSISTTNSSKGSLCRNQVSAQEQSKRPGVKVPTAPSFCMEQIRRSPPPILAKSEFPNVSLTTANTQRESVSDVCQKFSAMRRQGLRQLYFDRVRTIKDTNSASKSKRINLLLSSSSDEPAGGHFVADPVEVVGPSPKVDIAAANDDHSYSTSPVVGEGDPDDDVNMETNDESDNSSDDEPGLEDRPLAGKGRKSEADDWTANPRKLIRICKQIEKIMSLLSGMKAPQPDEDDCSARDKLRREKNKLASRACRLKKKAGLEANKIKLRGLTMEQERLKHYLLRGKSALVFPEKGRLLNMNQLMGKIKMTLSDQVAGNLTAFVETVIARSLEGKNSDFRFRTEWLN